MSSVSRHPSKAFKLLLPGAPAEDVCTPQAINREIRAYLRAKGIFPDSLILPASTAHLMRQAQREGSVTFPIKLANSGETFRSIEATLRDPHHQPIAPLDLSSVGL